MFAPGSRGIVLASVLAIIACKKTDDASPREVAPPVGVEGANCYRSPCNAGLKCTPQTHTCARPDHPEILADAEKAAARERVFLAQSGVEPSDHAERPPTAPAPTAGSPGEIRIVRVSNQGLGAWAIAACRPTERLVSGGCTVSDQDLVMQPSYPSSDSETDTIGGRWTCGWRDNNTASMRMEAFALCQRL
jgi:hypothetical protein